MGRPSVIHRSSVFRRHPWSAVTVVTVARRSPPSSSDAAMARARALATPAQASSCSQWGGATHFDLLRPLAHPLRDTLRRPTSPSGARARLAPPSPGLRVLHACFDIAPKCSKLQNCPKRDPRSPQACSEWSPRLLRKCSPVAPDLPRRRSTIVAVSSGKLSKMSRERAIPCTYVFGEIMDFQTCARFGREAWKCHSEIRLSATAMPTGPLVVQSRASRPEFAASLAPSVHFRAPSRSGQFRVDIRGLDVESWTGLPGKWARSESGREVARKLARVGPVELGFG